MGGRPVIAVVNDDTQFLRMMEMILSDAGYETFISFAGSAAFDELKVRLPDLIVLDIRMESPEAGWMLLDLLRLDTATADIPVIVCSADHEQLDKKEEYLRSKRAGVLRKPFDIDDLLTIVADHLPAESPASTRRAAGS